MKKYFAFILTSFLILGFVPASFACEGGKCSRGGYHEEQESQCPIVNKLLMQAHEALEHSKELGLSAEQINTIRGIKLEAKKANIRMMADMQIMELDMKSKLMADDFDAEGMKKMIDSMAAGMPEGGKKAIDWYAKFRSTLKADQWQKLKELR